MNFCNKEFIMKNPIILFPRLTRSSSHYKKYDIEVPKALHEKSPKKPNLEGFPYPLPHNSVFTVTVAGVVRFSLWQWIWKAL